MNGTTNWFNHDSSRAHQAELARAASREQLVREALSGQQGSLRVHDSALSALSGRLVRWSARLRGRAAPRPTPQTELA